MNCNATELALAAACYACLTKEEIEAIKIYLLCQWAQKENQ